MNRIALVEDHERLSMLVRKALASAGIEVDVFDRIASARHAIAETPYGAIVVDRGLPDGDGLSLVRKLRAEGNVTPCLMLTARDAVHDRVEGLEAGADDYLAKPFEPLELVLRIRAMLRRAVPPAPPAPAGPVAIGAAIFDPERGELRGAGGAIRLTAGEAALLGALARRAHEVLSRDDIAAVLGMDDASERAVDVQVTRLRRKIEADPREPRFLLTVRGRGYVLKPGAG
jgi:two-component system, OmpR family, phosphate regulon response regulator OmpR